MENNNSNNNNKVNNNSNNFKKVIDVRGLYCPEPVFRTKIEIEKMTIGERLKVVADDPQSEEDISRWVNRNGHDLISVNKNQSDLEFVIKKAK
ncbi:MAG: tusA [Nitrososphaeraceae archaeon]|nr:tusA [Nitrososphaeraceae archaeon]